MENFPTERQRRGGDREREGDRDVEWGREGHHSLMGSGGERD